ncbi:MAG: nitrate reductase molybdenum cofactor assembly chaperone [Actinomycetia bacterium]|nr:nitrate reductase molybdenum cofactor assembly chaperone [Actinomycetes bacterium]
MTDVHIAWKLGGWGLDYPDDAWRRTMAETLAALDAESMPVRRLGKALRELMAVDPDALRQQYVELFDFHPRRSLALTYGEYGDRRERGAVLWALVRRLEAAGFEPMPGHLGDEIPLLLEYCAESGDREVAARIGVVLRRLVETIPERSPYRDLMEALVESLPAGAATRAEEAETLGADDPDDVPFPLHDPEGEATVL